MTNFWQKVKGYKTYFVAGCLVLFAVTGFVTQQLTGTEAGELLLQAAALAGLRNALQ